MTAEENYRLLLEIQANRDFILQAYRQNPALLRHAETGIRLLFDMLEKEQVRYCPTRPCRQPQTNRGDNHPPSHPFSPTRPAT
ncbi:MAG: hypothetical protein C0522_05565 [Rhodocyclaceae bacterium]|jgi:hypothetical protein|nr:hypothetical protein [Rhodocyclaceae bacterium]